MSSSDQEGVGGWLWWRSGLRENLISENEKLFYEKNRMPECQPSQNANPLDSR
jgi:hypothetical protein